MAIQVGFSPPPGASVVRDPTLSASGARRQTNGNHRPDTTKKNVPSTTRKFLAAGGLALGLGSFGLFTSAGTAAADGMDATPMPPAVIDEDGFHNYDIVVLPGGPVLAGAPVLGVLPGGPVLAGEPRRIRAARTDIRAAHGVDPSRKAGRSDAIAGSHSRVKVVEGES